MKRLSRRRLLVGGVSAGAALPFLHEAVPHQRLHDQSAARASAGGGKHTAGGHGGGSNGATFRRGEVVDHEANGFNPTEILRDFDIGSTRRLPNGRTLREWEIVAADKEIEVAPGG